MTYILKDYQDKAISGSFYEFELAKVRHSDIYLVEKILKVVSWFVSSQKVSTQSVQKRH